MWRAFIKRREMKTWNLKRSLKRQMAGLLALFLVILPAGRFTAYGKPDWPADTGIMAESGIVVDAESGTVLFGQQIHVAFAPASIVKLLTALVTVENASLDEMVVFSHDAVYNVESGSGNSLSLEEGDRLSVEDCLYALLLRSSNQAANALAEHVAGSREAFVELMNQRIKDIGCTESHFANPSGLNDEEQYVTAYDMALIAREAFENETVLSIASASKHTIPSTIKNPEGLSFSMEHRLLTTDGAEDPYYVEGALAGKTGYTSIAGNTLVTCAERDGRRLISVILKGTQPQYYLDGKTLLEFGFDSFKNEVIEAGNAELLSAYGYDPESYELAGGVVTLPETAELSDAQRSLVTELPPDAPEDAAAMLQYSYNDRKIGNVYILLKNDAASAAAQGQEDTSLDGEGESLTETAEPSEADSGVKEPKPESPDEKNGMGLWGLLLALLAVFMIAGGVFAAYLWYQEKKEAERRAARRKKRMERLLQSGVSQEEFEQLMAQRHTTRKDGRSVKKSRKK